MSHTDKTDPGWRKLLECGALIPDHHHDSGPCDLPTRPAVTQSHHKIQPRCQWVHDISNWPGDQSLCGCRGCTGYFGRRSDRRKTRHNKRKDILERLDA